MTTTAQDNFGLDPNAFSLQQSGDVPLGAQYAFHDYVDGISQSDAEISRRQEALDHFSNTFTTVDPVRGNTESQELNNIHLDDAAWQNRVGQALQNGMDRSDPQGFVELLSHAAHARKRYSDMAYDASERGGKSLEKTRADKDQQINKLMEEYNQLLVEPSLYANPAVHDSKSMPDVNGALTSLQQNPRDLNVKEHLIQTLQHANWYLDNLVKASGNPDTLKTAQDQQAGSEAGFKEGRQQTALQTAGLLGGQGVQAAGKLIQEAAHLGSFGAIPAPTPETPYEQGYKQTLTGKALQEHPVAGILGGIAGSLPEAGLFLGAGAATGPLAKLAGGRIASMLINEGYSAEEAARLAPLMASGVQNAGLAEAFTSGHALSEGRLPSAAEHAGALSMGALPFVQKFTGQFPALKQMMEEAGSLGVASRTVNAGLAAAITEAGTNLATGQKVDPQQLISTALNFMALHAANPEELANVRKLSAKQFGEIGAKVQDVTGPDNVPREQPVPQRTSEEPYLSTEHDVGAELARRRREQIGQLNYVQSEALKDAAHAAEQGQLRNDHITAVMQENNVDRPTAERLIKEAARAPDQSGNVDAVADGIPAKPAAQTEVAAPEPVASGAVAGPAQSELSGVSTTPTWVQDEIDRRFAEATKLGIVNDVIQGSANGDVAKIVAANIVKKIGRNQQDIYDLVRGVKSKLGIPSMDDPTEFAKWKSSLQKETPNAIQEQGAAGGVLREQGLQREGQLQEVGQQNAQEHPATGSETGAQAGQGKPGTEDPSLNLDRGMAGQQQGEWAKAVASVKSDWETEKSRLAKRNITLGSGLGGLSDYLESASNMAVSIVKNFSIAGKHGFENFVRGIMQSLPKGRLRTFMLHGEMDANKNRVGGARALYNAARTHADITAHGIENTMTPEKELPSAMQVHQIEKEELAATGEPQVKAATVRASETTKQTIRETTGQANSAPEAKALASQLKAEEKGSKTGYKAGHQAAQKVAANELAGTILGMKWQANNTEGFHQAVRDELARYAGELPPDVAQQLAQDIANAKTPIDYRRAAIKMQKKMGIYGLPEADKKAIVAEAKKNAATATKVGERSINKAITDTVVPQAQSIPYGKALKVAMQIRQSAKANLDRMKDKAELTQTVKDQLAGFASELPRDIQAKFINDIRDAKTVVNLHRALHEMDQAIESWNKKNLADSIMERLGGKQASEKPVQDRSVLKQIAQATGLDRKPDEPFTGKGSKFINPAELNPAYRDGIKPLVESLRTQGTIKGAGDLANLLESETEAGRSHAFNEKELATLRSLDGKSLRGKDAPDADRLELLDHAISHVGVLNHKWVQADKKFRARGQEQSQAKIMDEVSGANKDLPPKGGILTRKRSGEKSVLRRASGDWQRDGETVLAINSGGKNSELTKVGYRNVAKGENASTSVRHRGHDALTSVEQSSNIKPADIVRMSNKNEKITLGRLEGDENPEIRAYVEMTPMERMDFANHWSDPETQKRLLAGSPLVPEGFIGDNRYTFKVTPAIADAIIASMSPAEKAMAEAMRGFVDTTIRDEGNAVFVRTDGFERLNNPDYWMRTRDPTALPQNVRAGDRGFMRNWLENLGVLKARTASNAPIVLGNAREKYLRHIDEMGRFIGMSEPIRDFIETLGQPEVGQVLRQKLGKAWVNMMLDRMQIASGTDYRNKSGLLSWTNTIRSNMQTAILGFRYTSPITHLVSGWLAATDFHGAQLANYLKQISNPRNLLDSQTAKFLSDNSPYFRDRWERLPVEIESPTAETASQGIARTRIGRGINNAAEFGTRGLTLTDKRDAVQVYKTYLESGLSPEHAIEETEWTIRRTGTVSSPLDMSYAQLYLNRIPFANFATMFTSKISKIRNVADTAIQEFIADPKNPGKVANLAKTGMVVALMTAAVSATRGLAGWQRSGLSKDFDEMKKKGMWEAGAELADVLTPGLGDQVRSIESYFEGHEPSGANAVEQTAHRITGDAASIVKSEFRNSDKLQKLNAKEPDIAGKSIDILVQASKFWGVPLEAPIQYGRGIYRYLNTDSQKLEKVKK